MLFNCVLIFIGELKSSYKTVKINFRDCHCPEKIPDLYKVALEAGENEDLFV